MGVRQVVEDDRLRQAEQVAFAREQPGLEGLAMRPEQVADAVQLGQGDAGGVLEAEQFEGGAVVAQPAVGLAFGGRMQHAGDDQGGGDGGIALGRAGLAQQGGQAELLEGLQAEAFGADGTAVAVVEGVEADGHGALAGAVVGGEAAGAETADEVLGGGEDVVRDGEEGACPRRSCSARRTTSDQRERGTG